MRNKYINLILILLIIADSVFSFMQFYHTALDGDVAESVLPTPIMEPLFKDPLGLGLFNNPTPYHNPNRYFSHYSYFLVFNYVPGFLQSFLSPINSIYATAAFFKLLIQLLLIFLISLYIQQRGELKNYGLLMAAVLIVPFFQSFGYRSYIGVIDPAITYVFFYAFPAVFVLIFYLPLLGRFRIPKHFLLKSLFWICWSGLAFFICLSGPLNPGIVLIVNLLVLVKYILKRNSSENIFQRLIRIPCVTFLLIILVSIFAMYSLYIGSFNEYTISGEIPLAELYSKIPTGVFELLTGKIAWPIIAGILGVHYFLLQKDKSESGKDIRIEFKWIAAFAVLYIILLPLGGFRSYRPLVLRYDTILPITLASVYLIGRSTLFLQEKLSGTNRLVHRVIIILLLAVFIIADRDQPRHNACERTALATLAKANESPVKLSPSCTLMSWDPIRKPEDSHYNALLFRKWNITENLIQYYQD